MFYQAYSADAILNIIPGIWDIVANGCQHAHASDYYTSFTQFFNPFLLGSNDIVKSSSYQLSPLLD